MAIGEHKPCFVSGDTKIEAIKNCHCRVFSEGTMLPAVVYHCTHPAVKKVPNGTCPDPLLDSLINTTKPVNTKSA